MTEPDLTAERLAELDALAEKATPGPWRRGETLDTPETKRWSEHKRRLNDNIERGMVFTRFTAEDAGRGRIPVLECFAGQGKDVAHANAGFIAACDPDTVRALVRMARRLIQAEQVISRARAVDSHAPWDPARGIPNGFVGDVNAMQDALRMFDSLEAGNE